MFFISSSFFDFLFINGVLLTHVRSVAFLPSPRISQAFTCTSAFFIFLTFDLLCSHLQFSCQSKFIFVLFNRILISCFVPLCLFGGRENLLGEKILEVFLCAREWKSSNIYEDLCFFFHDRVMFFFFFCYLLPTFVSLQRYLIIGAIVVEIYKMSPSFTFLTPFFP